MSPIKERTISGDFRPNLDISYCFTCYSAGKVIKQIMHGYIGSEPITEQEEESVWRASADHLIKKGSDHNIVIYHFENVQNEET